MRHQPHPPGLRNWMMRNGYRVLLVELTSLWGLCWMTFPLILNSYESQGKFNPYVSDSITLNSLSALKSYLKFERSFFMGFSSPLFSELGGRVLPRVNGIWTSVCLRGFYIQQSAQHPVTANASRTLTVSALCPSFCMLSDTGEFLVLTWQRPLRAK